MRELRPDFIAAFGFALAVCLMWTPLGAHAETIEGRGRILCAPTTVIACGAERQCSTSRPDAVGLPSFIRVDFKKKNLSSAELLGSTDKNPIDRVAVRDGRVFVQGSEGERAWSLVIDQHDGSMTGASASAESAFVFYGKCTMP